MNYYDYNRNPLFFSKIIRFQATFKDTVEFTCALEFKISSQRKNKNEWSSQTIRFIFVFNFPSYTFSLFIVPAS